MISPRMFVARTARAFPRQAYAQETSQSRPLCHKPTRSGERSRYLNLAIPLFV